MDIDDADDPWKDEAVVDKAELEGLDGCPFGQYKDDTTGKCVEIPDGGYSDDEFDFDDTLDDFVPDMLSDDDVDIE